MSPSLFELDGVSVEIDRHRILDDVSLSVPDEGITVVVGPSGAGKSTLLRLLNQLEVPSAGSIRFRGEPLDAFDPLVLRRRVGMVFQRPAPFPGSVRDNLLVADSTASEDRLLASLDAAGLPGRFLDRSADDLSGGESQRMCLARALVNHPDVLLMDEPTSALDPEVQGHLEATALRLVATGHPMVWVTHDLVQAARLASNCVVLIDGRLATNSERARYLATGSTSPADRATDASAGNAGETGKTGAGEAREAGGTGAGGGVPKEEGE